MFADFQILFLSFCALQGLYLVACLFFIRNRNSPANILMMCLIAVICLFLFRSLLWRTELIYEYPHFLCVFWGWPLLIGPLLYFYTCSNTFDGIRFSLKQLLHFVPIIIIFLCHTCFSVACPEAVVHPKLALCNAWDQSIA